VHTRGNYNQNCPIARWLDVLGERWTLLILREVVGGPRPWCFPSPSNCSGFWNEQHRKHPGAGTTKPLCLRPGRCFEERDVEAGPAGVFPLNESNQF